MEALKGEDHFLHITEKKKRKTQTIISPPRKLTPVCFVFKKEVSAAKPTYEDISHAYNPKHFNLRLATSQNPKPLYPPLNTTPPPSFLHHPFPLSFPTYIYIYGFFPLSRSLLSRPLPWLFGTRGNI